ncbi:alpha/beta hydrolase [Tamlana sp. 62-3]|uniref:Alpha/beta hydrolase n=1 Tax=Neotamlana sargassicola TaxID=2883125 RepID=A0A9X1I785_9FLAO|nr:alpha/beta fold hydrolase [Tamlana sargassicola]MCB4807639.1 alpha/beta hydrolase [Tamlana sargassicola]
MSINFYKIFRFLKRFIITLVVLYVASLIFLYFKQERFFFNPKVLDKNYKYSFKEPFEELNIPVDANINLNAVKFKANNSKGIILYFHGNAGAIHEWGTRAHLYLENNYDVLFVDYRGYGKSDGAYTNSNELLSDAQQVYNFVKKDYKESEIIVFGFSLGSGLASYVASKNKPKQLILGAPYYSWQTLIADEIAPPVPKWIMKYDIKSYEYLKTVSCPITIFCGTRDFLVNPKTNAEKLQAIKPEQTTLYYITDAGHNGLHITKQYYDLLKTVL